MLILHKCKQKNNNFTQIESTEERMLSKNNWNDVNKVFSHAQKKATVVFQALYV